MTKKLKPLPRFKSEATERKFWETHDSTEYVDWSKAERAILPNLKPSTQGSGVRHVKTAGKKSTPIP